MSGRSAVVLALVATCGRAQPSPAASPSVSASTLPVIASAPSASSAPSATADEPSAPPGVEPVWSALVRDERWNAAWSAMGALSDAAKARPEVRYARARVALARGDAKAALPLLDGLEASLPLLAEDVGRRRAEAELSAGPFADAGEWFAARSDAASQLDAARAFAKVPDAHRARACADRVLASSKHSRSEEAEARALRIRVGDPAGDSERADARWLATHGADVAPADPVALLARVDPKHPLTAEELLVRARVLSDAGRTDDALHAVDASVGAPGSGAVTDLDRGRARGMALFHAHGRGGEAAKVLADCAAAGGAHAAEDAFHAARALSRADRDEEAIAGYEDVERRFPKSKWTDSAAFFVPYLRMLHAQWKECAAGFDAYLRPRAARERDRDARRDGGLCKLLQGDAKGARPLFERLSEDEHADPVASARMADMAALAALRDADRTHALALWTDVVRSHPLSWPALVARARLEEAGATIPLAIEASQDAGDAPPLAVSVPPLVALLHSIGLEQDAEMAMKERESAVSVGAGGRVPELLCSAYGELGRARRRYQISQALPSSLFGTAPDPHTRWAWDCAYPAPYADTVHAAEAAEALPQGLLWAVMRQESGFDPDAISAAHAVGLMQLLPETARAIDGELAIDPDQARLTSPSYAIAVGARALHRLLDRFHGNVPLAVAAYNSGAEAVERWLSRAPGMDLDTFVERIPFDETREYVARVMGNFAHYGYLARGEEGVPRVSLALKSGP